MAKAPPNLAVSASGLAELKQRFLFLFIGLIVYRVGCYIPVPGLDPKHLADYFHLHQNGMLGLFNMFSGGALQRLTVFALGIMPYITSSIIIQLFSTVSPKLEELKKEGESGQRKINQYIRYGTLGLAIFQAVGMCRWLAGNGVAVDPSFAFYVAGTVTLVTGTMFLMWLGEQMTERGIGNGISMLIFAGIVARLPEAFGGLMQQVKDGTLSGVTLLFITIIVFGVTAFVVFMERGQRQIRVNYAKRQQGRQMYMAQASHLPLKINMSGVIPPIFASSILLLPVTLAQWFGQEKGMEWLGDIAAAIGYGQPLYMLLLSLAILFFAFFYTALVFNPRETAENLKRSGAFIPGIRPGEQTAKYIDLVISRLTLIGALYLILVSLMPELMILTWHVPFYFGGTSLLIIVVVIMDFMAQIQAHLMSHQYESLMRKTSFRGKG